MDRFFTYPSVTYTNHHVRFRSVHVLRWRPAECSQSACSTPRRGLRARRRFRRPSTLFVCEGCPKQRVSPPRSSRSRVNILSDPFLSPAERRKHGRHRKPDPVGTGEYMCTSCHRTTILRRSAQHFSSYQTKDGSPSPPPRCNSFRKQEQEPDGVLIASAQVLFIQNTDAYLRLYTRTPLIIHGARTKGAVLGDLRICALMIELSHASVFWGL